MKKDPSSAILHTLFPPLSARGDQTKLRMVEAAIDILASDGIEALTFEAVGTRVGMNKAQVRYHFPAKDLLVKKAIEWVLTTVQDTMIKYVAPAKGWEEQLLALADAFIYWSQTYSREAKVYLLFYYLASRVPEYQKLHTEIVLAGRKRFQAILTGHKANRGWSAKEVDVFTTQFWAILDGFTLYFVTVSPEKAPRPKEALELIRILIRAKL